MTENGTEAGVQCRACGCKRLKTTNTWEREVIWLGVKRRYIRRRRVCQHCGKPFTTVEHEELDGNTGVPDVPSSVLPNPFVGGQAPGNPFIPPDSGENP